MAGGELALIVWLSSSYNWNHFHSFLLLPPNIHVEWLDRVELHLIIPGTVKQIERPGNPDESTETQVLDLPLHVESVGLDVHGGEEIVGLTGADYRPSPTAVSLRRQPGLSNSAYTTLGSETTRTLISVGPLSPQTSPK